MLPGPFVSMPCDFVSVLSNCKLGDSMIEKVKAIKPINVWLDRRVELDLIEWIRWVIGKNVCEERIQLSVCESNEARSEQYFVRD